MIGYYSYVIFALILIYAHTTNQVEFYTYQSLAEIKKEFRAEKLYKVISETLLVPVDLTFDITCDKLAVDKKRELCDWAMEYMVTEEGGEGVFGHFLERGTETDPSYPCTTMPVEHLDMEKRMYFCYPRRFQLYESDEVDQIEGFYISGSQGRIDRAYIFVTSLMEDDKVTVWSKMESVDSLVDAIES